MGEREKGEEGAQQHHAPVVAGIRDRADLFVPSVASDGEYIVCDVFVVYSRHAQVTRSVYSRVALSRGNASTRWPPGAEYIIANRSWHASGGHCGTGSGGCGGRWASHPWDGTSLTSGPRPRHATQTR